MNELINNFDNLVIMLGMLTIAIFAVFYVVELIFKGVKYARLRNLSRKH